MLDCAMWPLLTLNADYRALYRNLISLPLCTAAGYLRQIWRPDWTIVDAVDAMQYGQFE